MVKQSWKDLSYPELAFQVLSLYISRSEIPAEDLKTMINKSYSTFRSKEVTPLVHLNENLYLLELFHGPSYSFKDCMSEPWHGCDSSLTSTRRLAVLGQPV